MKVYLLIIFSCIFTNTYCQKTEVKNESVDITSTIEIDAIFPGGNEMFRKYINNNIQLPEIDEGTSGRIIMGFTVNREGLLTDIKLLKNTLGNKGIELAEEVTRVLKLSPKWIPAKMNGKPVSSSHNFPIDIGTIK